MDRYSLYNIKKSSFDITNFKNRKYSSPLESYLTSRKKNDIIYSNLLISFIKIENVPSSRRNDIS